MSCQVWLHFLNYLVCIISFLKVKALLPALCTLTLTNTSSGDIREWCSGSWQIKNKVEKDLHHTYIDEIILGRRKKRNSVQRWWQRSFLTFPLSTYLKCYLAKKRAQDSPRRAERRACEPIHTPESGSCQRESSLASQCFTSAVSWAGQLGVE